MSLSLDLLPLAGFASLMATAAVEDFRRLVIPNWVVMGLCALWPLHIGVASSTSLTGGFAALGCAATVFVAGALLFSRGFIGGGDVKLLTAATLWAGPGRTPELLIVTALLGGLLSLVLLAPLAMRAVFSPADGSTGGAKLGSVPYGIAIAGAALIVTLPPNLN